MPTIFVFICNVKYGKIGQKSEAGKKRKRIGIDISEISSCRAVAIAVLAAVVMAMENRRGTVSIEKSQTTRRRGDCTQVQYITIMM